MAVSKIWTTLVASTTIRAADLLGNDAYAEGNIVPHSTGTLANNEFALGTSTAKWLNLYADKITISTGTSSFAGPVTMADNQWVGLGSGAGRIEFDNQATDEINFISCHVG